MGITRCNRKPHDFLNKLVHAAIILIIDGSKFIFKFFPVNVKRFAHFFNVRVKIPKLRIHITKQHHRVFWYRTIAHFNPPFYTVLLCMAVPLKVNNIRKILYLLVTVQSCISYFVPLFHFQPNNDYLAALFIRPTIFSIELLSWLLFIAAIYFSLLSNASFTAARSFSLVTSSS